MALIVNHPSPAGLALPRLSVPRPSRRVTTAGLGAAFLALAVDALLNARSFFDLWALRQLQRFDLPFLHEVLRPVDWLTSGAGAVLMWVLVLGALVTARWWLPALTLLTLPLGGLINEAVGLTTNHQRPTAADAERFVSTSAPSFPSGHVAGAVLLYGFLFVVADRIANRPLRLGIKVASLGVIGVTGFARVWYGAHWPSDVLGAYALGGLLLTALIATYRRLDAAVGDLPFIKAATPAHDESVPHAHALTSLVLFNGATVSKVYAPGFLPRAIYWLAFQAEFPYIRNEAALRAAEARRNLAALLTEFWYGATRVARVTSIDRVEAGYALTSEFVDGHAPTDRAAAKAWLRDLRGKFEAAGLPTWQIDPRQPRAVDNVMEAADGRYMIVDLESGLVAPIASPKTWLRGLGRGQAPLYDDVFFDITRAYIAREEPALRAALGDAKMEDLMVTLNAAETAAVEWHRSEPRLIGQVLRAVQSGFYVRSWPAWTRRTFANSQEKAQAWIARSIETWETEGRVTAAEAEEMRAHMNGAEFQAMLPHLGAHIIISIILRFPFGSIARAAWSAGALAAATGRLLARRIDRRAWKQAWSIHSPLVIVLSMVPGFGGFAYLAAKPVRSNRLVLRATADTAMQKVPWRLYQRTRLHRVVGRPIGAATAMATQTRAETKLTKRWLVPQAGFLAELGEPRTAEQPARIRPIRIVPGREEGAYRLPRTRTGSTIGEPARLPAA